MISNLDELLAANKLLEECRHELRRERVSFDEAMPIGIMIETPAAAMIADILAQEIDFFSIGTNDLIQYGSAVDRLNEKIADLYQPTHPGILRLIKQVVCAADEANVSVGVCGEMAGDPFIVPLLVGLGVRHLSVSAPLAPPVKYVIRKLEVPQAVALANQALSSKTSNEVMSACKRLIAAVAPDLDA